MSASAEWRSSALKTITVMIKRKRTAVLCKPQLQTIPFPAEGKNTRLSPSECLRNHTLAKELGPMAATFQSRALLAEWGRRKNEKVIERQGMGKRVENMDFYSRPVIRAS